MKVGVVLAHPNTQTSTNTYLVETWSTVPGSGPEGPGRPRHPNHEPRPRLTWWRSCCRDRALMAALSACRPGTWRRASGDAAGACRRLGNLTESRAVFWVAEAEKY